MSDDYDAGGYDARTEAEYKNAGHDAAVAEGLETIKSWADPKKRQAALDEIARRKAAGPPK